MRLTFLGWLNLAITLSPGGLRVASRRVGLGKTFTEIGTPILGKVILVKPKSCKVFAVASALESAFDPLQTLACLAKLASMPGTLIYVERARRFRAAGMARPQDRVEAESFSSGKTQPDTPQS